MKKIRLLFILILMLSTVSKAHASWTYIFCATSDGKKWHWLENGYGGHVTISGRWRESPLDWGKYFKFFSVSEEDYFEIKDLCPQGYIAQPANNKLSDWAIFRVYKADGEWYYTKGRKSMLIVIG